MKHALIGVVTVDERGVMRIHVKKHGAQLQYEDAEWFAPDEEIAAMMEELPTLERMMASRPLHGMVPILDAEDDDFDALDDFDVRAFVKRTYQ